MYLAIAEQLQLQVELELSKFVVTEFCVSKSQTQQPMQRSCQLYLALVINRKQCSP